MSYLRPYQQEAKDSILSTLSNGSTRTMTVLPTGCGKTELGLSLAQDWPDGDVLWLAHRQELIYQPAERWHKLTGQYADIEMADFRASNLGHNRFICASVQTLYREKRMRRLFPHPKQVGLVVVDECFPAYTLVDGRPIATIKPGDMVLSYNHTLDIIEERRVRRVFRSQPWRRSRPWRLVTIHLASGRSITCTSTHPFFSVSRDKYAPACELRDSDILMRETCSHIAFDAADDDVPRATYAIDPARERVDHVEVHKESKKMSTQLCPDGVVYNLDIETNHNYFAEGVLVHNCHHAARSNQTYSAILDYLDHPDLRVLGLTATPDRTDEESLGKVFDSVAYEYPLFDINNGPSAIADGWLVPIKQEYIVVESLDFAGVGNRGGDFIDSQLERVLIDEKPLHRITAPTFSVADGRQTLVFTAGIEQASRMTEILNRHKQHCAMAIVSRIPDEYKEYGAMINSGDKDARRRHLRRFDKGEFQFLANMAVLTEGFDCPGVSFISCARPTKSRSLYSQMVGRGTRVLPGVIEGVDEHGEYWRLDSADERKAAIAASDKPSLLVADFVGNSNHPLICSVDILGNQYPDHVVDMAKRRLLRVDEQQDVAEVLAETVDRIERDNAEAERKKRDSVQSRAAYQRKKVDPFSPLGLRPTREPGWHKGRKPTRKQLHALRRFKLTEKEIKNLSFWQASQLLDRLITRAKEGKATFKQSQILQRYGFDADVTFAEASKHIDHIARTYWKKK